MRAHVSSLSRPSICFPVLVALIAKAAMPRVGAVTVVEEPTDAQLCPENLMPQDWLGPCLAGQLLFSHALSSEDLMPEVGNGHLATKMRSDTIFAAGLFNGPAHGSSGITSHRARIPRSMLWVASVHDDTPPGCGRALDLDRAVFLQRTKDPLGALGVLIEERWYAPLQVPTLLVHEIKLENPGSAARTVTIHGIQKNESDDLIIREVEPRRLKALRLETDSVRAVEGSNKVPEGENNKTFFAMVENVLPRKVSIPANHDITLYAMAAIVTSLNSTDPTLDALKTLQRYMANGFSEASSLFQDHVHAWRERAEAGRIEVVGDLALAQIVNASLYFIRSSVREDWTEGLSPGGLSSNCYHGHTFWDQETWMWPPLLALEPKSAASLLRYRFNRIHEARKKAQACGSDAQQSWCPSGYSKRVAASAAMFPWESAHTGVEVQYNGGKIGPWGQYEQHISGDIALAVRQYWHATHDRAWLRDVGFPLAAGIAHFYAARLQTRAHGTPGAAYNLNEVMGPDEYQWPVSNSAYSNAVARVALEFARQAAKELGQSGPAYEDFQRKAEGIPVFTSSEVPGRADLIGGYHPEYEGFPKNAHRMTAKQADTILLSYPIGLNFSEQVLRNDLDFYEGITDPHGPAMTWSLFAMGWLRVGDYERSIAHFRRGYANAHRPYGVWSEFPHGATFPGCVNFLTGAGGFLQSLIFGTSGMRIEGSRLHFKAVPLSATGTRASKLALHSLHYRGSRLRMEMDASRVSYELLAAAAPALCITVEGRPESHLQVGVSRSHDLGLAAAIHECGHGDTTTTRATSTTATTTVAAVTTSTTRTLASSSTNTPNSSTSKTAARSTTTEEILVFGGDATTELKSTTVSLAPVTTGAPTPRPPGAASADVIVLMLVQNLDHAKLVAAPDLALAFEREVRAAVALAAGHGVRPADIVLALSPGSVAVRAAVHTPDATTAGAVRASLGEAAPEAAAALRRRVAAGVTRLAGIDAAATGPIRVGKVVLPTEGQPQVPLLLRLWPALVVCLGLFVVALAGQTAARSCPHSCSAPEPLPVVSADPPFNGTWVRKADGTGTKDARGSIIVIIGDTVNWHAGRKSRILRRPQEGYLITNPLFEDVKYTVEIINGELVVDGDVFFTRWQKRSDPREEEVGLLL